MARSRDPRQPKNITQQEGQTAEQARRGPAGARGAFLDLQRTAGNQAIGWLLESGASTAPPAGLEGVAISPPGSAQEAEAARLESRAATGSALEGPIHEANAGSPAGQRSPVEDLLGEGQPLADEQRLAFGALVDADLGEVRVHTGAQASVLADSLDADALTLGRDIVIGGGHSVTQDSAPAGLMAHELTHVAQQQGATGVAAAASTVFRKTKGEEVVAKATTSIEAKDQLKAAVDVLRVALRDTKKGKAVGFNKQAGLKQVETAAKVLGLTTAATDSLKRDWEWLIDNRKAAETDDYRRKEIAFFSALRSPLATLAAVHPESHAENLLRNTPPQVVDVIFNVADATIPPLQLYTYAAIEGLLNRYVRPQLGLASTAFPTKAQLATVRTDKPISGFVALGLDDFMTEMNAPREPLSKFLPAGYDPKKAQEVRHINEKGREVRSAEFADLKTALQALLAMLKRRRTLFEQDAKAAGYATPTEEELVYWTYVYFNFGEFGGKQQLQKFKGKRKLSDWISNQEFPNSIKLLQTFKMLKAMKLF